MDKFLKELQKMICEKRTEYMPVFDVISKNHQNKFKKWVKEIKMQTWAYPDGWEKAWEVYNREYLYFIIEETLTKQS